MNQTYTLDLNGQIIVIENVPAQVHMETGERLFSPQTKVSTQLAAYVRVRVTFAGNREPLFHLLQEHLGGHLAKTVDPLAACEHLS